MGGPRMGASREDPSFPKWALHGTWAQRSLRSRRTSGDLDVSSHTPHHDRSCRAALGHLGASRIPRHQPCHTGRTRRHQGHRAQHLFKNPDSAPQRRLQRLERPGGPCSRHWQRHGCQAVGPGPHGQWQQLPRLGQAARQTCEQGLDHPARSSRTGLFHRPDFGAATEGVHSVVITTHAAGPTKKRCTPGEPPIPFRRWNSLSAWQQALQITCPASTQSTSQAVGECHPKKPVTSSRLASVSASPRAISSWV